MKVYLIVVALLSGFFISSCSGTTAGMNEEEVITVFTSIVPQQYFVDRIGGDYVKSIAMVEPGASPATYEPRPSQMAALKDATVYFSIGVPFEYAWLEKIANTNQDMKIIDTTQGIEKKMMDTSHIHDDLDPSLEDADHEQGSLDPHVWVSPALVKIQAQNIYSALVEADPDHEEEFTQNLESFLMDIEVLEVKIQATLAGVEKQKFLVFHPSWGYFADEFGLEMIAIEVGGTEPSAAELAMLIDEALHEEIRVVFAQPEFSTVDAKTIAKAIDGEVILISPLAYDWLENMQLVADTFAEVLD